ncbi:unnamed protein product [Arctia plantaginis]|uniref:Uncharacterized protein n=1 Tax=Arctia plantaginis TaxID=874455 RepID=A0A8S1ASX7_ARCPL|nr:unnamed protein product [Arctia plantaginis]
MLQFYLRATVVSLSSSVYGQSSVGRPNLPVTGAPPNSARPAPRTQPCANVLSDTFAKCQLDSSIEANYLAGRRFHD